MKKMMILMLLGFSQPAFARQYIQCSIEGDGTEALVLNLETDKGGTLYLVSGIETEEEGILVEIQLKKTEKGFHVYEVVNEAGKAWVTIPSESIGKASDDVILDLDFGQYRSRFGCFSRIYLD